MAIISTTFSEYEVGAPPEGWAVHGVMPPWPVVEAADATDGVVLRGGPVTSTSRPSSAMIWMDHTFTEFEAVTRFRYTLRNPSSPGEPNVGVVLRAQPPITSNFDRGYYAMASLRPSDTYMVLARSNGTSLFQSPFAMDARIPPGEWALVRACISGDGALLRASVWLDGEGEPEWPAEWIDYSANTPLYTSGRVGVAFTVQGASWYTQVETLDIDYVIVSTDGCHTAPVRPPPEWEPARPRPQTQWSECGLRPEAQWDACGARPATSWERC